MAATKVSSVPIRWWLIAPSIAIALFAVPLPPWAVEEFYSRDIYPWLQRGLTTLSNLTDVAILDVLIGVGALLLLYRCVRLAMTAVSGHLWEACWEGIRRLIRFVSVLVILFMMVWGFNYRRRPLEEFLTGPKTTTVDAVALESIIRDSDRIAAGLRSRGDVNTTISYAQAADELAGPMNAALEELSRVRLAPAGRPKVSRILTPFFTLAGVNGMLDPFALESIVQPDLLPIERPFVLAHEWAHMAGHGDEAEASAIGWLACLKGTPTAVYSASVYLIMEGASALPADARQRVLRQLDAGIRADISAISRRMLRENPQVQRAASRVYDKYLQANRVEEGVASYSRAVSLILTSPIRDALDAHLATPGAGKQ
jgi:hypothetical protein